MIGLKSAVIGWLCLGIMLAGCASQPPATASSQPPTVGPTLTSTRASEMPAATVAPLTDIPTATQIPAPQSSGTGGQPSYGMCAYSWASQDMPELTAKLQAAVSQAGLLDIAISAYAFGEDCHHPDTGKTSFGAMETDFRVNWTISDPNDIGGRAASLAAIFDIILAVPPEDMQGPNPGRIEFDMVYPDHQQRLYVRVETARQARADGLTGSDLLNILSETP